jgi:hypothetical protein
MEILKKTDIDWCERILVSKLYIGQSVKVRVDQGVAKSVKIGRGVRKGCCLSPLYLICIVNTFPRKLLKVLETSK